MATSKTYFPKHTHRFLPSHHHHHHHHDAVYELDESEFYNTTTHSPDHFTSRYTARKPTTTSSSTVAGGAPASLPVNVPDWSKILKEEYRETKRAGDDGSDDEDDDDNECHVSGGGGGRRMVPPHEFLARTRTLSFSVHEGKGRTLKGRDLSRVRNAVWEKIGFQD